MNLKVTIVKKYFGKDNLLFVFPDKDAALKSLKNTLNKEEKDFLIKQLADTKNGFVSINRLNRMLFIQIIHKGKKQEYQVVEELRKTGNKIISLSNEHKLESIIIVGERIPKNYVLALTEGIALSSYQFLKYKSKASDAAHSLKTLQICSDVINQKQLQHLILLTDAVYTCRDFVNEPVCNMNSVMFSKQVAALFKNTEATVDILNKSKIEALKMNGLLAVNKGSVDPPAFIIIEWKPLNHHNKKPYVFVGKGLMYDTGGINVKTAAGMETMKCDMAGGAAVVSTLYAIANAKMPFHVVGLVPVTDNRPAGNSLVPGDIITYSDGTHVEVLNSDAEGRLILADGLIYAKRYKPQLVITLATLTGSAHAAIGKYGIVGMKQKAQKDFREIQHAGDEVFERVVEFPFWDDYDELIKSDTADIKNIGGPVAGAITAGKFLAHFAQYPFIHLDIAGPAFNDKKDNYRGAGGSGVGVRLLYDFMERKLKIFL